MTITTAGQFEYLSNRGLARAGRLFNKNPDRVHSYVNAAPRANEVILVTPVAANNAVYSLVIETISVSYTADASATIAEISAGLMAAVQANAILFGLVTPRVNASNLLELVVRRAGDSATVTGSTTGGGSLTITTPTAGAASASLDFGLGVILDPNNSRGVILPLAANLVARQVDLTPTAVNNATYSVSVDVLGRSYLASFTADGSATAAEITDGLVAILNGLLPASTVVASNDSDNLRLTAEVAGQGFGFAFGSNSATATWVIAADNNSVRTDINRGLLGVTGLTDSQEARTVGSDDAAYAPGQNVNVLREGLVVVEATGASEGDPVYIGTSASEAGMFFPSSGSGRLLLDASVAEWHLDSVANLAYLFVR